MIVVLAKYIMVIKSRRVTWAGYVARMDGKRNPYLWFCWNTGRKRPFERPWLR